MAEATNPRDPNRQFRTPYEQRAWLDVLGLVKDNPPSIDFDQVGSNIHRRFLRELGYTSSDGSRTGLGVFVRKDILDAWQKSPLHAPGRGPRNRRRTYRLTDKDGNQVTLDARTGILYRGRGPSRTERDPETDQDVTIRGSVYGNPVGVFNEETAEQLGLSDPERDLSWKSPGFAHKYGGYMMLGALGLGLGVHAAGFMGAGAAGAGAAGTSSAAGAGAGAGAGATGVGAGVTGALSGIGKTAKTVGALLGLGGLAASAAAGGGGFPGDIEGLRDANLAAGDLEYEAAQRNIGRIEEWLQTASDETAPWRDAGLSALEDLTGKIESGYFTELIEERPEWEGFDPGDIEDDPAYQFRVSESEKALGRFANVSGTGVASGRTADAWLRRSQDLAGRHVNEAYSRAVNEYGLEVGDWEARQGMRDKEYGMLVDLVGVGERGRDRYLDIQGKGVGQTAFYDFMGAQARGNALIGAANAGMQSQWMNFMGRQQRQSQMMNWFNLALGGLKAAGDLGWRPFE